MGKISLWYRPAVNIFGNQFYHKFIVYDDGEGNKYTLGGYPENDAGNNKITDSVYGILFHKTGSFDDPNNPDSFSNNSIWGEDLYSGPDVAQAWKSMLVRAAEITSAQYNYHPLQQSCNSFADNVF